MLASLRGRLTLSFALVFAVLGATLWLVSTLLLQAQADRETQELLRTAATQLVQDWESPEVALEDLRDDGRFWRVAVMMIGPRGEIMGTSRRDVAPWPRTTPTLEGWRVRHEQVGSITLIFSVSWQEIATQLRRQAQLLAGLTLVLVALATALARLVIGRTLQPIGALAAQAEAIGSEVALRSPSQDAELRHLVSTLNGLLVRQRESAQAREAFAATASHELRTPLTVLLGTLEVALSRPREVAEYQETLLHLQTEAQHMAHLTESLLLLSRLTNRYQQVPHHEATNEATDISTLCEEILASLEPLRNERSLTISSELAQHVVVSGSSTALFVLVRNLLDNAHRHAAQATDLKIVLKESPTTLTIINSTEPTQESQGTGLGLSLCQRLAEGNGWQLDFQHRERCFQATLIL